jgi:Bax protein
MRLAIAARVRACAGILGVLALLAADAPALAAPVHVQDSAQSRLRGLAAPMAAEERKRRFIKLLLPLLQNANHQILKERRLIIWLAEQIAEGGEPGEAQRAWLAALAERYGAPPGDFDELLQRVDIVPPSLALGQAALESGWGASRSAQVADALFGEMARNGRHPRRFQSPAHSVQAYVSNLNTHPAYGEFRRMRAAARQIGRPLDPLVLAVGLRRYSVLGHDYVRHVRSMIRVNGLQGFDDLWDSSWPGTVAEVPKPPPEDPPL